MFHNENVYQMVFSFLTFYIITRGRDSSFSLLEDEKGRGDSIVSAVHDGFPFLSSKSDHPFFFGKDF